MKTLYFSILTVFYLLLISCDTHGEKIITFENTDKISIFIDQNSDSLLLWAANDLSNNLSLVLDAKVEVVFTSSFDRNSSGIFVGLYNSKLAQSFPTEYIVPLEGKWECYIINGHKNQLFISGSDIRGAVYGLFEVAKHLGISPWDWWADVTPIASSSVSMTLPQEGEIGGPSVKYRGVFLNDEDWGLHPWAAKTFEPEVGDIGPRTYEKIFQLLLKLKANTIWPAMHPCTKAFYSIEGNREMAEKYHILIGTSHAEPMLRNNVDEWDKEKYGDFNYFSNREKVKDYWRTRVDEIKTGEQIYTLGMRGIHDSGMRGSSSQEERVRMVDTIIMDQREMLGNARQQAIESIPQVLIPYKEVLYLYNDGLQVPDDVTLMWTDDNYGYIRRHSTVEEQKRKGGAGVYYHLSYWGRPHDYLWLSSTQPGLIWYEMSRAYQNGAQQMWIANVGDIKPSEYNVEFFLDLAWDINGIDENSIEQYLENWCKREFGESVATDLRDVMSEYYRLAMLRKPEYMGWSTTEPTTQARNSGFTTNNGNELSRRIKDYGVLYDKVNDLKSLVPRERADAYFQLVIYPVQCAALMNHKFLYAHLANSASTKVQFNAYSQKSLEAYDEITALTQKYNNTISNGKWQHVISKAPRGLPVFKKANMAFSDASPSDNNKVSVVEPIFLNAAEYVKQSAPENCTWGSVESLGYSQNSMTLFPLKAEMFTENQPYLEYAINVKEAGEYNIELRCLPSHSNDFDHQVTLEINDKIYASQSINSKGRSDDWKQNVLRNYVAINQNISFAKTGKQILRVYVNHSGIVLDQIAITLKSYGAFYEIPK